MEKDIEYLIKLRMSLSLYTIGVSIGMFASVGNLLIAKISWLPLLSYSNIILFLVIEVIGILMMYFIVSYYINLKQKKLMNTEIEIELNQLRSVINNGEK